MILIIKDINKIFELLPLKFIFNRENRLQAIEKITSCIKPLNIRVKVDQYIFIIESLKLSSTKFIVLLISDIKNSRIFGFNSKFIGSNKVISKNTTYHTIPKFLYFLCLCSMSRKNNRTTLIFNEMVRLFIFSMRLFNVWIFSWHTFGLNSWLLIVLWEMDYIKLIIQHMLFKNFEKEILISPQSTI
jgi:hypothetical protein